MKKNLNLRLQTLTNYAVCLCRKYITMYLISHMSWKRWLCHTSYPARCTQTLHPVLKVLYAYVRSGLNRLNYLNELKFFKIKDVFFLSLTILLLERLQSSVCCFVVLWSNMSLFLPAAVRWVWFYLCGVTLWSTWMETGKTPHLHPASSQYT